jgi:hypothetical protein
MATIMPEDFYEKFGGNKLIVLEKKKELVQCEESNK